MKTTTIGRIGAIVTGAAMLGTAVASALAGAVTVDATLTKGFFYDDNMNPKVQIVVGDKAQASDGAVAGQIAAMIGNMAFKTTTATAGGVDTVIPAEQKACVSSGCQTQENAEGEVTLSWEAIGLVGELQQKEMTCAIYNQTKSNWMEMTGLDDGGDSGNFCEDSEVFGPEDSVGTTLVGACETGAGADVAILKTGEFANEICTICYNFCDIALGCEPHLMSEWVNLSCSEMSLGYDCEEQALNLLVDDDAIFYNVFTDDILTEDILDGEEALVGQSYLGKIILGQNEYYVEDVDDDSITIVCGATGKATTTAPMEYTAPAEGSACDAADSDKTYSLKLVGAQTIEEKGVVDVTLEVTKPDGTTEQVTSGISGTPVVGDIKVKLQRGTAASNVITGEQSFAADLLVWYVPSEYTFEDDEQYTEEGVKDTNGVWALDFNGGNALTVSSVEALEDAEELTTGVELPDDITENEQWEDCYEDTAEADQATTIIRYLEFALEQEEQYTELPEGAMIQLPFNDGKYLLSDLKFGYLGLMNGDFLDDSMIDTTALHFEVDSIDVDNASEAVPLYRKVTVDFVDEWGTSMESVRLDEGPFATDDGEMVLIGDTVYRIDTVEYNDSDTTQVFMEYSVKDGADWTSYEKDSDDELGDAQLFDTALTGGDWTSTEIDSVLNGITIDITDGWIDTNGPDGAATWIIRNLSSDDEGDWEVWVDKNEEADEEFEMAQTILVAASQVKTEFDTDVEFYADDNVVTVTGNSDTGAEDSVVYTVWEDAIFGAGAESNVNVTCIYDDSDCEDIAYGDEDGKLISLSGALIEVEGTEIEELEDSGNESYVITALTVTVPEDELRPTIFFGTESSVDSATVTITEADVGTVIDIGGIDVTVDEFGVTGAVTGASAGGAATVTCGPYTATCASVDYETKTPATIGYQLVVVEGAQTKENLVLIGGPSVNSLTKDLTTASALCEAAVVKLTGNKLLVAGCEAADTAGAAADLMNWLKANVA